jgi:hypothetical protein
LNLAHSPSKIVTTTLWKNRFENQTAIITGGAKTVAGELAEERAAG